MVPVASKILAPRDRSDVYQAIDKERDYQDRQWPGDKHSVTEWILYIEDYIAEARTNVTRNSGDLVGLDSIRKIAAMAVCCMEENGIVQRGDLQQPTLE